VLARRAAGVALHHFTLLCYDSTVKWIPGMIRYVTPNGNWWLERKCGTNRIARKQNESIFFINTVSYHNLPLHEQCLARCSISPPPYVICYK